MKAKYLDRLDIYDKEIEAYALARSEPSEFETYYVEHYREAVFGFLKRVVPDEGPSASGPFAAVNEDRMRLIAWQMNERAWQRMEHYLHAGFGSMSGEVSARAEAFALREVAVNMHKMATTGWLTDMGGRIPTR
jgi:hypothetical protein